MTADQVVAHRIRELRRGQGLTMADVAARIDALGEQVTRQTLSKIERGNRPVSVGELVLIAYVLGVTPTSLMTARADTAHEVRLTPTLAPVPMTTWRRWVTGRDPLDGQTTAPTWVIDAGALSAEAVHAEGAARSFPDV